MTSDRMTLADLALWRDKIKTRHPAAWAALKIDVEPLLLEIELLRRELGAYATENLRLKSQLSMDKS